MKSLRTAAADVLALFCIALAIVSALAYVFEVRDPQVGAFLRESGLGAAFILGFVIAVLYGRPKPHRRVRV